MTKRAEDRALELTRAAKLFLFSAMFFTAWMIIGLAAHAPSGWFFLLLAVVGYVAAGVFFQRAHQARRGGHGG